MYAASSNGHEAVVGRLLEYKANPDIPEKVNEEDYPRSKESQSFIRDKC